MKLAVIKVRSNINVRFDIKKTFEYLKLMHTNNCVIIDDSPSFKGMLQKAKDYITWGEIKEETLSNLIKKRGRILGDKNLTDDFIKGSTEFKSVDEYAKALFDGKSAIPKEMKSIFRLHPPKKGYRSIKKPFSIGGALGYRGEKINDLLEKMI